MKIIVDRAALIDALAAVRLTIERRNTIPILANVRLEVTNGALHLLGTDMDLSIGRPVAGEKGAPTANGATTAHAETLLKMVKAIDAGSLIELSEEGKNGFMVRSGRTAYSLSTLPAVDFPIMAAKDVVSEFEIAGADYRRLYDATAFAISTEETRYCLNGIYLHAVPKGLDLTPTLRAVSTDGHRLALAEVPMPDGFEKMPGHIVPRKSAGVLRKLLAKHDGAVTVTITYMRTEWRFGDTHAIARSIDGNFPDYQRAMPLTNSHHVTINVEGARKAIKRVMAVTTERQRAIKVTINGALTLSCSSPDQGRATEEIECARNDHAVVEIGFNADYLDVILDKCGDEAVLEVGDSGDAVVIRGVASSSERFVLMPVRV